MTDSATRLALCIPAYNAAPYLPRLLKSAAAQTQPFDEILVYDDASTDSTASIAAELGARVIRGEKNLGCAIGKNRLADATACEWIHFHDADDALLPDFSERARNWIAEDSADVVLFSYEYREHATSELILTRHFDDDALRSDPLAYALREDINPFAGIYRRNAYLCVRGDEDPAVLYNEDAVLHIRLAAAGLRFRADRAVTVVNFRVPGSMSSAHKPAVAAAQFHSMRKAAQLHKNPAHQKIMAARLWEIATHCGVHDDWENAAAALRLARSLDRETPSTLRPPFRWLCAIHPLAAYRFREFAIRLCKPHLRPREKPPA